MYPPFKKDYKGCYYPDPPTRLFALYSGLKSVHVACGEIAVHSSQPGLTLGSLPLLLGAQELHT